MIEPDLEISDNGVFFWIFFEFFDWPVHTVEVHRKYMGQR